MIVCPLQQYFSYDFRMLEGDNGGMCTMEPCVLERFPPQGTARLVSQQVAY